MPPSRHRIILDLTPRDDSRPVSFSARICLGNPTQDQCHELLRLRATQLLTNTSIHGNDDEAGIRLCLRTFPRLFESLRTYTLR